LSRWLDKNRQSGVLTSIRPEPEQPLALSLSKGAYRREAWFDKLTTNGSPPWFPFVLSLSKDTYRREA